MAVSSNVDPETKARRAGAFERLGTLVGLLVLVLGGTAFVSTAASTSAARLAVMQPVETYALAVHHQLVRNHSLTGTWVQTIHMGYEDAWTWSGHHALTLIGASAVYPLLGGVLGLTVLQIIGVALGAIPAALLGRRALGSAWGLGLGAAIYLGHPAVMALALQDYQDLVFIVPSIMVLAAALGARRAIWVPAAVLIGLAPREEALPLVVACALVVWPPGGWRRWVGQVALTVAMAGAYGWILARYFPATTGVQGPEGSSRLGEAVAVLLDRGLTGVDGWSHLFDFYALSWAPLGGLALASPLGLLPAIPLIVLHMAIPDGNGIDRVWAGHAHHLAPAVAFIVLATITGAGRLLRWASRLSVRGRVVGPPLALVSGLLLLGYNLLWLSAWSRPYNLVVTLLPRQPTLEHPVWTLARRLPSEAVPVVSTRHAIAVSDREVSYTWEESLFDKAGRRGLGAATHLLAPRSASDVVDWALAMPGATIVDEHEGYVTVSWPEGSIDASGRTREHRWPAIPDWYPAGYAEAALPGVPLR